jgi:uncharacterized protein (UPF0335 family)
LSDTAGVSGDRICSFIERIERIDEEMKALSDGKKEVFSEAKGEGFRREGAQGSSSLSCSPAQARQTLLDVYLKAMENAAASRARAA